LNEKISFFIPYFWSPHLETDLELIHKHLQEGDSVDVYICAGDLPTCYSNVNHEEHICNLCRARRRNGFRLLEIENRITLRNFLNLNPADLKEIQSYSSFDCSSVEKLRALVIDDCEVGKVVHNELICQKTDTEPDLEESAEFIAKSITSYLQVYHSFRNHFLESRPDMFYTFNGRFVIAHSAVEAARSLGVSYAVHDRAGVMNRYWLAKDRSLFSISHAHEEIEQAWASEEKTLEEKVSVGASWFDDRLDSKKQSWFSFTDEQTVDLPASFQPGKTNIVIFNSSEWESAGHDDYRLPFYETQNEGLLRIADDLKDCHETQIYLRVHPHLKNRVSSQLSFINELVGRFPNFEVIPAESSVKSYSLMMQADAVLTFGSTVGIEAAYKRIPSILLGRSWYEELEACTKPTDHDDLVHLIRTKGFRLTAEEMDRRSKNALKYGYYFQTSGLSYELFQQSDIFEMKFREQVISYDPPPYDFGLRLELQERAELTSGASPLKSTVIELQRLVEQLSREKDDLKSQLAGCENRTAVQPSATFKNKLKTLLASFFAPACSK
jgi:hypothetical protein